MIEIDFFFDYSCPWSYLAFTRLLETATRTGARIVWKPVVVDWVLKQANPALASSRADSNPRKASYYQKDLSDWAKFCDVTITYSPQQSVEAVQALRGVSLAVDQGKIVSYSRGVFSAYFAAGEDIGDLNTLCRIAEAAGMSGEDFKRRLGAADGLEQIQENSNELLERGGFGAPTLFVDETMYFGNDRMPLVEFAVGQASGREFVPPGDHRA
jgi:2-hydroxychromene-2-carboxylate isomerase